MVRREARGCNSKQVPGIGLKKMTSEQSLKKIRVSIMGLSVGETKF